MVRTFSNNYFYYPDGSTKPYFKMKKPAIDEIILQHPYLGFDPQNYQIYREEYHIESEKNDFLNQFIKISEKNLMLGEDEIYWYDTGFWSVIDNEYLYIGVGEKELIDTIKIINNGKFAYCLSHRDLMIFIKGEIENKKMKNQFIVDVYSSNYFLPFVEVMDSIRKTIKELGKAKLNSNKKMNFKEIFVNAPPDDNLDICYTSCYLKNKKNIMIPYAVMPRGRWVGPVVVPNNFKPYPLKLLDQLEFIFTQFSGGSLKSDFFKPDNRFYYSCFIGHYSDVIILEGKFHYSLDEKDENVTAINDSGIDKSYLDYFTK